MNIFEQLKNKIVNKKAVVGIIGLGYVGLPLAVETAKRGFTVMGIDTNSARIKKIKNKISYLSDISKDTIAEAVTSRRLQSRSDFKALPQCDIILICVPTPLGKSKIPNINYVIDAAKKISQHLRKGQLIILESTIYPGATEEKLLPVLERSGLKAGKDFYLAFSPERIDPGNKIYKLSNIPKVIGGINRASKEIAICFYSKVTSKVIPLSSTRAAEMVKLLENTFRIVNIALANEFASICYSFNLDPWEIIEAAKTKPFGFMPFYPGPGAGGHCIPITPLFLEWKAKKKGYDSKLITISSQINKKRTKFVAQRIADLVSENKGRLKKPKVIIIGVTYKKDVKDLRDSPAIEIIEMLQKKRNLVKYHDPYIPYLKINNLNLKNTALTKKVLSQAVAVVILADHSNLNYKFIAENASLIIDTRNAFKDITQKKAKVIKI